MSYVIKLKKIDYHTFHIYAKAQKSFSLNLVLSQFYIPTTDFPPRNIFARLLLIFWYETIEPSRKKNNKNKYFFTVT